MWDYILEFLKFVGIFSAILVVTLAAIYFKQIIAVF